MYFNTAISQMMFFINQVYKEEVFPLEYAEGFIKLLNPVAPHITEEIWSTILKHNNTIAYEKWPTYIEEKTIESKISIPVQINGKLRCNIEAIRNSDDETIKQLVYRNQTIQKYIDGKTIVKEIYVKNKIYNIVLK